MKHNNYNANQTLEMVAQDLQRVIEKKKEKTFKVNR